MKPNGFEERRRQVMQLASARWYKRVSQVAEASRLLARGGPGAAASQEQVALFRERESLRAVRVPAGLGLERVIGPSDDLEDLAPSESARLAGLPVARIVELLDSNTIGEGFATGFVVGPGLLMTNWHVFAQPSDAMGFGAQFGFERGDDGLIQPGVVFEIDPERFFFSDERLDVALVGLQLAPAIGEAQLLDFGQVRLIPSLGKILVGHRVSIIQHPNGRHKHWAVRDSKLVREPDEDELFLNYSTDTMRGSSGSPAFNHGWEMVALHHSAIPRIVDGQIMTRDNRPWRHPMPESEIEWVANEGVRVSKIYAWLKALRLGDQAQQALVNRLLEVSVDPLIDTELSPHISSAAPDDGKTGQVPPITASEAPMQIVVNGTANFYFSSPTAGVQPIINTSPAHGLGLEKKIKFDPDYDNREGYDAGFLWGKEVPMPGVVDKGELLAEDGEPVVLKYHHYSLTMHKARRLMMWSAANVDYDPEKRWRSGKELGEDVWKPDPRIRSSHQLEDLEFYEPAKKFDRGHIVMRHSVAWGHTMQEEEYGNSDSYHWTNCTPQHEQFNRAMFQFQGIWGKLENHIAKEAKFVGKKVVVFAGPVLDPDDPKRKFGDGHNIQVPMRFWKVVVASEKVDDSYRLRAYGFILDQSEDIEEHGWEARFRPKQMVVHQCTLAEITEASRVTFVDSLHAVDALADFDPNESRRGGPIHTLSEIRL